ncbi:hypothetical protein [Pseudomonas fluorescens]|uniref:hypothetical protein n=1 Tax=Pseudomonas fluorescens TaxID=294 RepID=UPI00223AD553|nr:hypothetical protein [Pseudomonas fluorescens]
MTRLQTLKLIQIAIALPAYTVPSSTTFAFTLWFTITSTINLFTSQSFSGWGGDHVVASAVAVLAMGMLEHFFRLAGGQPLCATPATTFTWGIVNTDFRFECLGPFSHRPNLAYVRYTRHCSRRTFDDQLCEKKTSNWRHAQ